MKIVSVTIFYFFAWAIVFVAHISNELYFYVIYVISIKLWLMHAIRPQSRRNENGRFCAESRLFIENSNEVFSSFGESFSRLFFAFFI